VFKLKISNNAAMFLIWLCASALLNTTVTGTRTL